jgi:tetratricopeptide (TPR) repeat protein
METKALSNQEHDAVSNAMHYALELHRKGILDQAERLYAGVLKLAPRHVEALHFLGVLKNQQGNTHEALSLMASALEINSGWAQLHVNYAFVLNGAGRFDAALETTGRALAIEPANADAQFHRGNALLGLDRPAEALAAFERAVALKPDHLDALVNCGNALTRLQRFEDAAGAFAGAVALAPGHPGILNNYGQALNAAGRSAEALEYFDRALAGDPHYFQAMINRAQAWIDLDRAGEALADTDRALALKPRHVTALNIRGLALAALGRPADAIAAFEAILAIDPDTASAYNNRGKAQAALNRYAEARASFQIATEITPTFVPALTGEALTYLVEGELAEGFAKYQSRKRKERRFEAPLWLGAEPLAGKTLLIYSEQGFGDTLQFVRYAPLAAALGATVVLEIQPALKSAIAGLAGIAEVVAEGERLPAHDLRCPMLSLPLAFRTTLATVPAAMPYLTAPAERVAHWQARLPGAGKFRVGVVWAGNRRHLDDRNRSIAPERLAPLFAAAGVQWIGLQTDVNAHDRAWLDAHPEVVAIGDALADFADTAAVMASLDLVLSVDTAAAHLAGAMARPVWIMLPFSPDWRWMLARPDSPWYPTAKLFRQPSIGDWDSVVAQVARELPAR